MREPNWPNLPEIDKDDPQAQVKFARYQAQLAWINAQQQAAIAPQVALASADLDREKLVKASDLEQSQAVMSAYLDVAKGQIDRATAHGQFVQTAAGAVSTIYVGVLGVSYAVDKGKPLPARGIAPTFFLGLAILLATFFLAYITIPSATEGQPMTGLLIQDQRIRRNTFIRWVRSTAWQRLYFLHAAVLSLGVGVLFLTAPFIGGSTMGWDIGILVAAVVAAFLTFLLPLWSLPLHSRDRLTYHQEVR